MNDQLVLLDANETPPRRSGQVGRRDDWRIDEHTRESGRRGVALAREALRQAAQRLPPDEPFRPDVAPRARCRRLAAFLPLLLTIAAGCSRGPVTFPAPPPGPVAAGLPEGIDVAIERIVDGDTIVVSGKIHVRLIGVDTPETVDPRRPVACFGKEASGFMSALLPRGTPVRLVGDVEQEDRYGRTLAYVYRREDGLFVNAELVRQGYAQVLTVPPNLAHTDDFEAAAREARVSTKGLWAACPIPG